MKAEHWESKAWGPPRHAPVLTPMTGLGDTVAQTPRSGPVCVAVDPGAWSAQRKALNGTCAWPFPPPQVYPGPEAGARLLGEFSGGGVRGGAQWPPASLRLALTRTRPTLPSLRRPGAPPRPLRLGALRDPNRSRSERRCPPLPTLARLSRRGRGGGEKGSNAKDSPTSCSQTLYTRRGARSSPAAPGPPDPPVTTEGAGEEERRRSGRLGGEPGVREHRSPGGPRLHRLTIIIDTFITGARGGEVEGCAAELPNPKPSGAILDEG